MQAQIVFPRSQGLGGPATYRPTPPAASAYYEPAHFPLQPTPPNGSPSASPNASPGRKMQRKVRAAHRNGDQLQQQHSTIHSRTSSENLSSAEIEHEAILEMQRQKNSLVMQQQRRHPFPPYSPQPSFIAHPIPPVPPIVVRAPIFQHQAVMLNGWNSSPSPSRSPIAHHEQQLFFQQSSSMHASPPPSQHPQYFPFGWQQLVAPPAGTGPQQRQAVHEEKRGVEDDEIVVIKKAKPSSSRFLSYAAPPAPSPPLRPGPMLTAELQQRYLEQVYQHQHQQTQHGYAHQHHQFQQAYAALYHQLHRPATSPLSNLTLSSDHEVSPPPPQNSVAMQPGVSKRASLPGSTPQIQAQKKLVPPRIILKTGRQTVGSQPQNNSARPQSSPITAPKPSIASSSHSIRLRDAAQFAAVTGSESEVPALDETADPFPRRPAGVNSSEESSSEDDGHDDTYAGKSPSPVPDDAWTKENEAFIDSLTASFTAQPPRMRSQAPPASVMARPISSSSVPARGPAPSLVRFVPSSAHRRASEGAATPKSGGAQTSAQAQRPRSTNGARMSASGGVAPRPGSRVGSAGFARTDSAARPKSSHVLSPRPAQLSAAAREAAEVFGAREEPARVIIPSGDLLRSPRALHPPPYTLSFGDSSFYSRLPDDLWVLIVGWLDSSALLTSLARLDRASRRLSEDQESWRFVVAPCLPAGGKDSGPQHTRGAAMAMARLEGLAQRWTLVEALDLSACAAAMRDEFFMRLAPSPMPYWSLSLRELSLAKCTMLTDCSLRVLAPVVTCLEKLDLSWCSLITDEGFSEFLQSCGRTLRFLVVNRCHGLTDEALGVLARYASALQDLDLTFCTNLTDRALELLAAKDSKCFYPCPVDAFDQWTPRVTLPAELPYTGLLRLSLRWCRKITDIGIEYLMAGGATPEDLEPAETDAPISYYDVVPPPLLTAKPIVPIPSARVNALQRLNIDHCSLLTDRSMMLISKSSPELRDLSAIYCKMLTPVAFQYLVSGSTRHLRRLVLDHCDLFHAYLSIKNGSTLRLLLASSVFQGLEVLSWKTCLHAGMERSRHQEIEAECCSTTLSTSHPSSSRADVRTTTSVSATAKTSDGNVMDWINKAPIKAPMRPWSRGSM